MLYLFWGQGYFVREKKKDLISRAREAGNGLFFLSPENFEPLAGYLGEGLFEKKICLFGESLMGSSAWAGEIKALLPELVSSQNIIFLFEQEIADSELEIFKKSGAKLQEIKKPSPPKLFMWADSAAKSRGANLTKGEIAGIVSNAGFEPHAILNAIDRQILERSSVELKSEKREPNYFAFADSVSAKNKRASLGLLNSYIADGFGGEEAFWKTAWKIKTLRQIQAGASEGLHPYVIKKSKEDLKNFSEDKLREISLELADIFSGVRKGESNFEEGLEKLLLRV